MVRFFKKLEALEKNNSALLVIFDSHPLPAERVQNVQNEINRMNVINLSAGNDKAFHDFKSRLSSIPTTPKKP
jgi:predicted Zn-dependent protease